jgi:glycosyltransferase involved in cell wall biosynthesis
MMLGFLAAVGGNGLITKGFSEHRSSKSNSDCCKLGQTAGTSKYRPRVLMISHLFPGRAFRNAYSGVFVVEQLQEYPAFADVYLVVPVDVTPSLGLLKAQRGVSGKVRELWSHWQRTVFSDLGQFRAPVLGEYVRFASVPPKSLLPFTVGIGEFLSIVLRIRKLGTFNVVHAQSVLLDGLGAVLTAKWLNVPAVVTAIGSDVHSVKNRVELATVRYVLRNAEVVTCVSKDLGTRVKALGVASDKVRIVGNGVNPSFRMGAENIGVRARHSIPREAPLVLSVGNLLDVKDPLNLVRAFRSVYEATDAHLIMVGGGVLEHRVREEVLQLGMEDRVHLAGRVRHEDVAAYMAACTVFCLPSVREGWPNVLLEAMLFGKPVVATRVGGIPEVVHDSSFGILTEPQNAGALGKALLSALGQAWDHGKITAYAEANSWAKAAEGYAKAYREAIRRKGEKK